VGRFQAGWQQAGAAIQSNTQKTGDTKVKKLTLALCAVVTLLVGAGASAETINYNVTGWQTTCWTSYHTGIQGDCLYRGSSQGTISQGTITGTAQFLGDSVSGGILTITTSVYVTSGYSSPATFFITDKWFELFQTGDPAGLTVTNEGRGSETCTPPSSYICTFNSTDLPVANINIYGPGNTVGGTLGISFNSLSGSYQAWQNYTLTVLPTPEPGTALLLGLGLIGLVVSQRH